MFTGLVEDIGKVVEIGAGPTTDFWVQTALGAKMFGLGESIAVNGACLTVVETRPDAFRVQAGPETLRRTTLGELQVGSGVHLERALQLGARLGGHLVLGHVDDVAVVEKATADGGAWVMDIALPRALASFFIPKGSVTVDGVSLTVNALTATHFSVALIPETQKRTLLHTKKPGDRVNLEADLIGKYVARLYSERGALSQPSADALRALEFGG